MALINCPECGKEISDKSTQCIHCGFPLSAIKKEEQTTKEIVSNTQNTVAYSSYDVEYIENITSKEDDKDIDLRQIQDCIIEKYDKAIFNTSITSMVFCVTFIITFYLAFDIGFSSILLDIIASVLGLFSVLVIITARSYFNGRNLAKSNIKEYIKSKYAKDYNVLSLIEKQKKAEEERKKQQWKYEHPECPICKSHNTRRITTASRAVSVATVGLASSKIGKQYECLTCKHKW